MAITSKSNNTTKSTRTFNPAQYEALLAGSTVEIVVRVTDDKTGKSREVTVANQAVVARSYSSGSLGLFASGKVHISSGVTLQLAANMVAIGSKGVAVATPEAAAGADEYNGD